MGRKESGHMIRFSAMPQLFKVEIAFSSQNILSYVAYFTCWKNLSTLGKPKVYLIRLYYGVPVFWRYQGKYTIAFAILWDKFLVKRIRAIVA